MDNQPLIPETITIPQGGRTQEDWYEYCIDKALKSGMADFSISMVGNIATIQLKSPSVSQEA